MIARIHGTVAGAEEDAVLVDLHGLVMRVLSPGSTLSNLPPIGSAVSLETHLVVREDAMTLYGFATAAELQFFELLIGVNGVGPRAALNLLTFADPVQIYQAIAGRRHHDAVESAWDWKSNGGSDYPRSQTQAPGGNRAFTRWPT